MTRTVVFGDAYPQLEGGAQELTRLLARELAARGQQVRLVVPGLGATVDRARADGTDVVVVPAGPALSRYGGTTRGGAALAALPGWWLRARRALAGADVVHANGQRGMVLFAPAARSLRIPVVYHRHTWPPSPRLDAVLMRLATVVVVPTPDMSGQVEATGRPCRTVVGWVPPPPAPDPAPPRDPAAPPRLATIGRLHPDKGVDVLLEALARVHRTHPDVALDVIGGHDPAMPRQNVSLQERAVHLGVGAAVHFHGHLADPWTVAVRARMVVQAARDRTETQGLALWQAMALGCTVVATDIPAFRQAVTDGADGRLVPPDDPAALADAITRLLDDPTTAGRLGSAAARRMAPMDVATMVDGIVAAHDLAVT